ncbi:hypothetical protein, partial [Escherichia coli]|uniref:hypothetical protein n=1 Tax=Escherichia coli TaxID=562 RepID=UPI001BAC127D
PQAPAAILLNYRYLANVKSVRKAIHKNNSKTINRHYSRNSQRTFENQHHNLLYWTYTSPDEYEAVSSVIQYNYWV